WAAGGLPRRVLPPGRCLGRARAQAPRPATPTTRRGQGSRLRGFPAAERQRLRELVMRASSVGLRWRTRSQLVLLVKRLSCAVPDADDVQSVAATHIEDGHRGKQPTPYWRPAALQQQHRGPGQRMLGEEAEYSVERAKERSR